MPAANHHAHTFFEELTASGAARISDYDSAVGTVWTYNAGLDWSPIRDMSIISATFGFSR